MPLSYTCLNRSGNSAILIVVGLKQKQWNKFPTVPGTNRASNFATVVPNSWCCYVIVSVIKRFQSVQFLFFFFFFLV